MPTLVSIAVVLQVVAALALCLNESTPFPVHHASRGLFPTGQGKEAPLPHEIIAQLKPILDLVCQEPGVWSSLDSSAVNQETRNIIVGPAFGWDWTTAASALRLDESPTAASAQQVPCQNTTILQCCQPAATDAMLSSDARIRATLAVVGGQHPGPSTLSLSRKLKSLDVAAVFFFPLHLLLALDVDSANVLLRALAGDGHSFGIRIESAPVSFAAIHSAQELHTKLRPHESSPLLLYLPPYALYPHGVTPLIQTALVSLRIRLVSPNWMLNEHEMVGRMVGTEQVVRDSVLKRIASNQLTSARETGWIIGVSGGNEAEVGLVEAAVDAIKKSNAVAFVRNPVNDCFSKEGSPALAALAQTERDDIGVQLAFRAELPCAESSCWKQDFNMNSVLDSFAEDFTWSPTFSFW